MTRVRARNRAESTVCWRICTLSGSAVAVILGSRWYVGSSAYSSYMARLGALLRGGMLRAIRERHCFCRKGGSGQGQRLIETGRDHNACVMTYSVRRKWRAGMDPGQM